jgi:hypothetical protein
MFCSGTVSAATVILCFKVTALSAYMTAQHTAPLGYLKTQDAMLNPLIRRMNIFHLHQLDPKLRLRTIDL